MAARSERCERPSRRDRKVAEEARRSPGDRVAVPSRIGNDDQDMLEAAVPNLEHDAADLRLDVDEAGLGFDRKAVGETEQAIDHRVPRALIPSYR